MDWKIKKQLDKLGVIVSSLLKIVVIIVVAFPFFWMIVTSFKDLKEAVRIPPTLLPEVFSVSGYEKAFHAIPFPTLLRNSFIVSTATVVLQYLIVVPAAYGFARCNFKGKGALFSLVLLGFMIPQQITFVPVYQMFSKMGVLNSYVPLVLPFISNAFGIFLLRQYFMQIPEEIIEAARLDDASELKIMWKIMMPMAKSALGTIGLLIFISSWNSYFWPLVMTANPDLRTLPIGVAILTNAETGKPWNTMMAANVILAGPILVIYMIASKQIRKAFVYSGIK